MNALTRCAPIVAAFFVITGCGGTGQNSLAPTSASSSAASRLTTPVGVPPGMQLSVSPVTSQRGVHAAKYSTKKPLVFESNFSTKTVGIYKTSALSSNPGPIAMITEPSGGCPYGMAVNARTLYLADSCLSQIELYPKGSTTMKSTITDGISFPLGVAIDKSQTLYVSTGSEIQEYAKGSTSPTKTITGGGLSEPFGVSLDSGGNLYIADFGASAVFELPAGGSSVTNMNLQDLTEPLGTAVDQKTGLLWVTDGGGDKINVYQLGGSTSPVQTIAGSGFPYAVSIQNRGKPQGTTVEADEGSASVYAYHAGQYTPYATLTNGVGNPSGVLITKP